MYIILFRFIVPRERDDFNYMRFEIVNAFSSSLNLEGFARAQPSSSFKGANVERIALIFTSEREYIAVGIKHHSGLVIHMSFMSFYVNILVYVLYSRESVKSQICYI